MSLFSSKSRYKNVDTRLHFRERIPVLQKRDDPFRRWFESDDMDLIVWYSESDMVIGFQICYHLEGEHALTWKEKVGFTHDRIEGGDHGHFNRSPILIANGPFPKDFVLATFEKRAQTLENELVLFIKERLLQFGAAHVI